MFVCFLLRNILEFFSCGNWQQWYISASKDILAIQLQKEWAKRMTTKKNKKRIMVTTILPIPYYFLVFDTAHERKYHSVQKKVGITIKSLRLAWVHCWWLKSCTTWGVNNPVNNGIYYLSTGAGFQPSTEWSHLFVQREWKCHLHDFIHQKLRNKHKQNDFISYYFSIFPILTYKIWKTATIYTFSIYIYDINSTAGDSIPTTALLGTSWVKPTWVPMDGYSAHWKRLFDGWKSGKRSPVDRLVGYSLLHPGKLTCPLKRDYFNRKYIFQPSFFRGYCMLVFRGGYLHGFIYTLPGGWPWDFWTINCVCIC